MKKLIKVLVPFAILVTSVACNSGNDPTPPVSMTDSTPSKVSDTTSVEEYRLILPNVSGFEVTASKEHPVAGEEVQIYVKNISPSTRRADNVKMNGDSLEASYTNDKNTKVYTIQMPANEDAQIEIEAVDVYKVLVTTEIKDQLCLDGIGEGVFAEHETVRFRPATFAGYSYLNVVSIDDDVTLTNEGGYYSFEMPAHLVTIGAEIVQNVYSVHYETSYDYEILMENDSFKTFGSSVSFQVVSKHVDKEVSKVMVDQIELTGSEGTYSFTMPAHSVSLSIEMKTVYKDITVQNSDHFKGTLKTEIEGELVEATKENIVSNQKVAVFPESLGNATGATVKEIKVYGGNALDQIETECDLTITVESGAFVFMTPEEYRYLRVEIVETVSEAPLIGSFKGFKADGTGAETISFDETGMITSGSNVNGQTITHSDEGYYTAEYSSYGMTYHYRYYASPDASIVIEQITDYAFGETVYDFMREGACKVFVKDSLFADSGNHFAVIHRSATDSSVYEGELFFVEQNDGKIVKAYLDFERGKAYFDVEVEVTGVDGKTDGDVVLVKTSSGTTLTTMTLTGDSAMGYQYKAVTNI